MKLSKKMLHISFTYNATRLLNVLNFDGQKTVTGSMRTPVTEVLYGENGIPLHRNSSNHHHLEHR